MHQPLIEQVALALHHPSIVCHSAIRKYNSDFGAVLQAQVIIDPKQNTLQYCRKYLLAGCSKADTNETSPHSALPKRRVYLSERGEKIQFFFRHILQVIELFEFLEQSRSPGPVQRSSAALHRTLVGIFDDSLVAVEDGSDQRLVDDRLYSDICKQEAACSICNFSLVLLQLVGVGRGLLVSQYSSHLHSCQVSHLHLTDLPERVDYFREHVRLESGKEHQFLVPLSSEPTHEGPTCVGGVGHEPSRQIEHNPRVDCSETDAILIHSLAHFGYVFDEPEDLEEGEVGGDREACALFEFVAMEFGKSVADLLGSGVTPYDCVVVGFAGLVPAHDCLSLVGDAQSFDEAGCEVGVVFFDLLESGGDGDMYIFDDFEGVVLEQALGGSELLVLDDLLCEQVSVGVVEGEFCGGGGLVQRCQILHVIRYTIQQVIRDKFWVYLFLIYSLDHGIVSLNLQFYSLLFCFLIAQKSQQIVIANCKLSEKIFLTKPSIYQLCLTVYYLCKIVIYTQQNFINPPQIELIYFLSFLRYQTHPSLSSIYYENAPVFLISSSV